MSEVNLSGWNGDTRMEFVNDQPPTMVMPILEISGGTYKDTPIVAFKVTEAIVQGEHVLAPSVVVGIQMDEWPAFRDRIEKVIASFHEAKQRTENETTNTDLETIAEVVRSASTIADAN